MKIAMGSLVAALALSAVGSAASGQVIWDQLNSGTGNVDASQQFEAAFAAYNIAAIDDFTVSSGANLGSVDFSMAYFNGPGPVNGWRVEIYSSPNAANSGNLVGDVAHITGLPGGQAAATLPNFVHLDVSAANVHLNPGTYWIGIMGVMDFGVGGQVGIEQRTTTTGASAIQVNPGGGFGFPNGMQTIAGGDLSFRLNAVPAPGSLALLGLGGMIAGRRRRR